MGHPVLVTTASAGDKLSDDIDQTTLTAFLNPSLPPCPVRHQAELCGSPCRCAGLSMPAYSAIRGINDASLRATCTIRHNNELETAASTKPTAILGEKQREAE